MGLTRGDTFIDDGAACPTGDRHLWVVFSDGDAAQLVIVSITSYRSERQDKTCTLQCGDHPFIRHTSIVYYHGAEAPATSHVEALIRSGARKPRARLDKHVLDSIVRGFGESLHTPPECIRILEEQGYL